MIELTKGGVYLIDGKPSKGNGSVPDQADARENTMAYKILRAHCRPEDTDKLHIKFDAMLSHDITYVGIIQSARYSGLKQFPIPYVLTNCHNSLCAVGGTINEDDHVFGLSAARKYGGIYVPANQSVIHMYAREAIAACGSMVLGSDSHTRYGALGTIAMGEGGPELVKQLLNHTYDIDLPEVIMVYLEGKPKPGIGPHDVAIALIKEVFANRFVNNKILEFVGPGIANLPMDFRNGIDVMTTETTCLSSIWCTDEKTKEFFQLHGRSEAYCKMSPGSIAYYDGMIRIDLSSIESMIALPFHPSNAFSIKELNENADDIINMIEQEAVRKFGDKVHLDLTKNIHDGKLWADQGIIAGCAGGLFDNICDAGKILQGKSIGSSHFSLSVYPGSVPVSLELTRNGVLADLLASGALIKPAFCGPCFGAGDVPANNTLSIRHTTRNFPNREGSKPAEGQISAVALMDARSIAATAINGGAITPATDYTDCIGGQPYHYDAQVYAKRVYNGFGNPKPDESLIMGPNITDWPPIDHLADNVLLKLAAVIRDPVTTTDELIPSGDTSSFRSNPLRLAEYTLSRRVPGYVSASKAVRDVEEERRTGKEPVEIKLVLARLGCSDEININNTQFGSAIFANRPGDGSAREQAASCQKVLGGFANICYEFATKRYRSNCINWGILPFTLNKDTDFPYESGDYIFIQGIRQAIAAEKEIISAKVITQQGEIYELPLQLKNLTAEEKDIILAGCLMNYYADQH